MRAMGFFGRWWGRVSVVVSVLVSFAVPSRVISGIRYQMISDLEAKTYTGADPGFAGVACQFGGAEGRERLGALSPITQPRRPCPPVRFAVSESAVFAHQSAAEEKNRKHGLLLCTLVRRDLRASSSSSSSKKKHI